MTKIVSTEQAFEEFPIPTFWGVSRPYLHKVFALDVGEALVIEECPGARKATGISCNLLNALRSACHRKGVRIAGYHHEHTLIVYKLGGVDSQKPTQPKHQSPRRRTIHGANSPKVRQ